ncbi:CopG family transcriptional regulator [Pseudaeromonas sharmana]|uniref:CopG family transcriptional regulator n=1 Tax=Pseudaeromonas sharmana TaxID=328412 RepID=A0ABV8CN76_9GAMM
MGLSDLKKKSESPPPEKDSEDVKAKTAITLDEFINDAELYALGHSRKITIPRPKAQIPLAPEPEDLSEEALALRAVFKKATYSMSLECIENLKQIAENDGMNRSQLLRLFTHYFYQLPPEERDLIYERFSHLFDNNKK